MYIISLVASRPFLPHYNIFQQYKTFHMFLLILSIQIIISYNLCNVYIITLTTSYFIIYQTDDILKICANYIMKSRDGQLKLSKKPSVACKLLNLFKMLSDIVLLTIFVKVMLNVNDWNIRCICFIQDVKTCSHFDHRSINVGLIYTVDCSTE